LANDHVRLIYLGTWDQSPGGDGTGLA
jgi:hypothetical protein